MADENSIGTQVAEAVATGQAADAGTATQTEPTKEEKAKVDRLRDAFGRFQSNNSGAEPNTQTGETATEDQETQEVEKTGTDEKESTESTTDETKTATPAYSTRQLEVAKQLSIDPAQLEGLTSAELLDFVGRKYNQGMSKLGRQLQEARTAKDNKAEPSDRELSPDNGELKLDFDYADSDFDSLGDDGITGKHNRHLAVTKTLMTRLSEVEAKIQEREDAELADRTDKFFAGLNKEEFPDFGNRLASELDEDSEEMQRRLEVVEEARALRDAYAYRGQNLSLEKALEKAVHYIYADNIRQAERKNMAKKISDRRQQSGSRPTARTGKPTEAYTHQEKMDAIREKAKEKGINW